MLKDKKKEEKKRPVPKEQGDLDEFIFGKSTEQYHSEKQAIAAFL